MRIAVALSRRPTLRIARSARRSKLGQSSPLTAVAKLDERGRVLILRCGDAALAETTNDTHAEAGTNRLRLGTDVFGRGNWCWLVVVDGHRVPRCQQVVT